MPATRRFTTFRFCLSAGLLLFAQLAARDAAHAEFITVGQDGASSFSVIQDAIDAATDGDEIIVSIGTYVENIHFNGKNIILRSTDPESDDIVAATVIDGNQSGSVVTFAGTEGTTCVLSGFTITNGDSESGGGIHGNGAMATISRCQIFQNHSNYQGGGVFDCDGLIAYCRVTENMVGGSPVISAGGGGLAYCDGCIVTSVIDQNHAIASGTWFSRAAGGGFVECNATILNCTIVDNMAWGVVGSGGGGIFACRGAIVNCILWGNRSGQVGESSRLEYSCIENWTGGGDGNIAEDPLFVDFENGDYRLLAGSPCIDTGGFIVDLTDDFLGNPRGIDGDGLSTGTAGDGSDFDMGAYEFNPVTTDCLALWGCFVERQYADFLNREAELQGYYYYAQRLCDGRMTTERAVANFLDSPEFAGFNGFIARCYFGLFNDNSAVGFDDPTYRIPDYEGMVFWNDVMQVAQATSGSLRDAQLAVIAGFTESAEWRARIGTLDDAAFVTLLYTHIFGRAPEPEGQAYHLANLQSGAVGREELIHQFLVSPEAVWRFERHTYVTMAYVGLLRRAPERAGFVFHMQRMSEPLAETKIRGQALNLNSQIQSQSPNFQTPALKSSFDIVGLVRGIIYSPEYIDRLAALGCALPYEPVALTITLPGGAPLELARISAGSFMMGRNLGEQDSDPDEYPQHMVTINYKFYLGKYELTKRQWDAVMGTTPWSGQDDVLDDPESPAVYVSWNDAQVFLTTLNTYLAATGRDAYILRLPSEAEWEYACRAETTARFYWGDDSSYRNIRNYAWYEDNAQLVGEEYGHIVGQKLPNRWGLFDMSGNVWEWCQDRYHSSYNGAPMDGSARGESESPSRVMRGGGIHNNPDYCRSASRSSAPSDYSRSGLGFRVLAVLAAEFRSITVDVTPDAGSWTLTGPAGFTTIVGSGDRTGGASITNAPPGDYSLTCDDNLMCYSPPAPQTQTLVAGGTLAFIASYTPEEGDPLILNLPGDVPLEMIPIPAGSFQMGGYPGELDSFPYEYPQHLVTIGYDYYMSKYELTKRQWEAVMGTTPWWRENFVLNDPESPAVWISWADSQMFLAALNVHLANTGLSAVRLPSEAEWEYACRAGTTTRFYWGDDPSYTQINDYAWHEGNAGNVDEQYAHAVGQKIPNAWGLYDMSGNVYEMCQDYWHISYDGLSRPDDGSAWELPTNPYRVCRGGGWGSFVRHCRSSNRNGMSSDGGGYLTGIRLVCTQD